MFRDSLGENLWTGLFLGVILGLALVLVDRLLKGFSLRAFSSATFGLLLGLLFANLLHRLRCFALSIRDDAMGRARDRLLPPLAISA